MEVTHKFYTTCAAAGRLGVSRQSLHAWIRARKIAAPPLVRYGKTGRARLWTPAQIEGIALWHSRYKSRRGRPRKLVDASQIAGLRAQRLSWRAVGRALNVSPDTARRAAQIA